MRCGDVREASSILVTSLLERAGRAVNCTIVNANNKTVSVTMDVVESDGSSPNPGGPFDLGPGEARSSGGCGPMACENELYCRFEVDGTSKKNVRAAICVYASGSFDSPCAATSEAR